MYSEGVKVGVEPTGRGVYPRPGTGPRRLDLECGS